MASKTGHESTIKLKPLARLVGSWSTTATHPAMPGVVVHGTVEVEWLEGKRFLIHRQRSNHADFPDSISIIGFMGRDRIGENRDAADAGDNDARLAMHYFDSRGVFRVYEVSFEADAWHFARLATGFSQRFTGKFADGGNTIDGRSQAALLLPPQPLRDVRSTRARLVASVGVDLEQLVRELDAAQRSLRLAPAELRS